MFLFFSYQNGIKNGIKIWLTNCFFKGLFVDVLKIDADVYEDQGVCVISRYSYS